MPTRLPCSLTDQGIIANHVAEGKHVATAYKKPCIASWKLPCEQSSRQNFQPAEPSHTHSPNKAVRPEAGAEKLGNSWGIVQGLN